jgi:hypothetical protein
VAASVVRGQVNEPSSWRYSSLVHLFCLQDSGVGRKQLLMQATSRLSVAVLVNVETTPVQLHATLFPSGDPPGEEFLRTCGRTPKGKLTTLLGVSAGRRQHLLVGHRRRFLTSHFNHQ